MIKVGEMVRQMRQTVGINKPKPLQPDLLHRRSQTKQGGEIRELHKAVLCSKQPKTDRTVNLQPLGSRDMIRIHLDLILYFNSEPVA